MRAELKRAKDAEAAASEGGPEEVEGGEVEEGSGQQKGASRLVGMVINLNAGPLTVAVMTRSQQHSGGLAAAAATELRSGATVRLGKEGHWMHISLVMAH